MQLTGFLIIGVSGSGKSTLGKALAHKLGWDFFDADEFHTQENIAKMAAGIPLSDSDRARWLASLRNLLFSTLKAQHHPVLACSALKEPYRAQLLYGNPGIEIIFLKGSYHLIWARMSARKDHYMKPEMLKSQFDILEPPKDALILDIDLSVESMIEKIFLMYDL